MILESWHKEQWIKTVTKEAFIAWCAVNKPEYTTEDATLIYESHVLPVEEKITEPVSKPNKKDGNTKPNAGEDTSTTE